MTELQTLQALEKLNADTKKINSLQNAKTVYSRIVALETQLFGTSQGTFGLNVRKQVERLVELEQKLAAKTATAPAPVAAKAATMLTNATTGAQLVAKVGEYLSLSADNRKQFCMDRGSMEHTDFSALNPTQKAEFVRQGGQVQLEVNRREPISTKMTEGQLAARRFNVCHL